MKNFGVVYIENGLSVLTYIRHERYDLLEITRKIKEIYGNVDIRCVIPLDE